MIEYITDDVALRLLAAHESEFEGEAIRQLKNTVCLEGMKIGVGLPDLHPGRGIAVGAALFCKGFVYPHVVGNDIGCGIGLWQTSLRAGKIQREKWQKKLSGLQQPWKGDLQQWLKKERIGSTPFDPALGTIGSGNHFAELQQISDIFCPDTFERYSLDSNRLFLLVHSGSRGLGEKLLRNITGKYGAAGIPEGSPECLSYLKNHDHAILWAASNRRLIAERFTDQLGAKCRPVLDVCHNGIERAVLNGESGWLHRKGAAPATSGLLVIPGSRGTLSYLVEPVGEQNVNLQSLPHGAGRKWNRKSCRARLSARFPANTLKRTKIGNVVICDDKDLLYEEAPHAYKNIDKVINTLQRENLVRVIATLKPLITYKRRKET